jgi:hypothetical protein
MDDAQLHLRGMEALDEDPATPDSCMRRTAMLDGRKNRGRATGSRRGRAQALALVSLLALVILGAGASVAQAEPTVSKPILTCKTITVTYSGFPNAPGNTIKESVRIDGVAGAVKKTFVFNGPEATDVITINLSPGEHSLDLFSIWKNSNGVSGNRDQPLGRIKCIDPEPELEVEKLQKFSTKQKYTKELLKLGHVGEIVDYEIFVRNTGNVPLEINFTDLGCDSGTVTGGPSGPLGKGESATYFCNHTLTAADREREIVCNTATATGTPVEGPTVTKESNTVCTEVPKPKTNTEFSCKSITLVLTGFPNVPNNMVKIRVTVDGTKVFETIFTFNGPTAVFTYELNLPPGHHSIDVFAIWNTNKFKGNHDQPLRGGITCEPEPRFAIEKLQKIEGKGEFTPNKLEAVSGETVDYEIIVTNTGNVPLKMSNFTDEKCDPGTIEGGPGETPVQPAGPSIPPGKTTYTCKHKLTVSDEVAGEYTNTARDTGNPPEGMGLPVTAESNTVVVKVGEIV